MSIETRKDLALAVLERAQRVLALPEPATQFDVGTTEGNGPASAHLKVGYVDQALKEALALLRPAPRVSLHRHAKSLSEHERNFRRAEAERDKVQTREARRR